MENLRIEKLKNSSIEKMKSISLAALLIASAAFVACSSSDDTIIDEPQPVNPTGTYTMTIKASKGSDAVTRALSLENSTLNATWAEGEEVTAYKVTGDPGNETYTSIGTLTAQSDGTTLSGTITAPDANDKLALKFLSPSYSGQDGTLNYIATHCDYAVATVTVTDVDNETGEITVVDANRIDPGEPENTAIFVNQQAIAKFTLVDKYNSNEATNKLSPTSLTMTVDVPADNMYTLEGVNPTLAATLSAQLPVTYNLTIPAATYTSTTEGDGKGPGVLYLAIPDKLADLAEAKYYLTFTLNATIGEDTYSYIKTGFPFENGKYYDITVKMTKQNLSIINTSTSEAVTKNGDGYYLADGGSYTISGKGYGNIVGNGSTMTFADGTVLDGNLSTLTSEYGDPNVTRYQSNIILDGDVTVNGDIRASYYDYTLITTTGDSHTLTVNGGAGMSCWRLASGVTMRYSNCDVYDFYYGYVHDANGNDITNIFTIETVGGKTYKQYVGSSGGGGSVVTVWILDYLWSDGSYVVFDTDEAHVALTKTNDTYANDYGQSFYRCTAPLTSGASTYTVYNSGNSTLASDVYVSDGEIYIYDYGGGSWNQKYW